MVDIKVYQFGEWTRARNRFHGLAFKMQQAADWATLAEATAMARRIRNNIYTQQYVGPGHPPDAPSTVARKAEQGTDTRTLIEHGEYVRAITGFRMGRYEYGVGVRDPKLADIGNKMEWGFLNRAGLPVPARPHYRVEMERTRGLTAGQRLPTLTSAMARVLAGQTLTPDAFAMEEDA